LPDRYLIDREFTITDSAGNNDPMGRILKASGRYSGQS
jgi:hypothetical protein